MNFSEIEFDTFTFKRLSNHHIELEARGLSFNQNLNTTSATILNNIQNLPFYDKLFSISHLLRILENHFRKNLTLDNALPSKTSKINFDTILKTSDWNQEDVFQWKTDYGEIKRSSFRQKEAVLYSIGLKKFAHILSKKKSKLLILTIPSPKEILRLENYSNDFKPFSFGYQDNIYWLDLLKPFTEIQYQNLIPLNYPKVIHWTPAGHFLAAQLTFNKLIQKKIIPYSEKTPIIQFKKNNQNWTKSLLNSNTRISKQLNEQGYADFVKGVVYINLNRLDLAEKFLKISLEKSFNISDTLWQLGRAYFFKKDFKNAISFIQRAINDGLQATDTVYTLLAKSFFNSKKFANAESSFRKAIDFFPTNYINYLNYGKMLFFQNRFNDSLNAFEKANALFPNNVDTLLGIASSLLRIEKNEKALEVFKNILKIDPNNIPAQKGLNYLRIKKAR